MVLAETALLRWMVNELPEMFGTAAWTKIPALLSCNVARTRLAVVSATPVLVVVDFPALMVRTPLRLKMAGPVACRAAPPPVLSARTPPLRRS